MIFGLTICGVSVTAILSILLMAIGTYWCATTLEKKYREVKRERAQSKLTHDRQDAVYNYAASAYDHMKDPTVREAMVREIADEVKTVLDSADIVLADQFKSRTKVVTETATDA